MLRQGLNQKLLQKLSPQQIQLMKMLQLPTVALEQRIKEEMEVNPALEEGSEEDAAADGEEENFEEDQDAQSEDRDDFALSDYMDDDEGASYKLKSNNNSP